jgi:hypothetical protein
MKGMLPSQVRRWRLLAPLAACSLLLTTAGLTARAAPAAAAGCEVQVITVHGMNEGRRADMSGNSPTMEEAFRGFNTVAENKGNHPHWWDVPYDAPPDWDVTKWNFEAVVDDAANRIQDQVVGFRQNCPDNQLVFFGYSMGAWVIDKWIEVYATGNQPYEITNRNSIKYVALFGDPQWNHGTQQGLARRYDGAFGIRAVNPYPPAPPLYSHWHSDCTGNPSDPVCGDTFNGTREQQLWQSLNCKPENNCGHLLYANDYGGGSQAYKIGQGTASVVYP